MHIKLMRTLIGVAVFATLMLALLGIVYTFNFISASELKEYATNVVSVAGIVGLTTLIITALLSFKK